MDEAVEEVFRLMLDRSCPAIEEGIAIRPDICACIQFSGALEARCAVGFTSASAQRLTAAFLGSDAEWDNTIIADAVGELCNMIAGGWKRRMGTPGSEANLSVPSISRLPGHCPHGSSPPDCYNPCMSRTYAFDNAPFVVSLTRQKAAGSFDPAARENPLLELLDD